MACIRLRDGYGRVTAGEFESQAGNVSIVYLLELDGKRLLFTGDIEPNVADRIADELKPHSTESASTSS